MAFLYLFSKSTLSGDIHCEYFRGCLYSGNKCLGLLVSEPPVKFKKRGKKININRLRDGDMFDVVVDKAVCSNEWSDKKYYLLETDSKPLYYSDKYINLSVCLLCLLMCAISIAVAVAFLKLFF